MCEPSEDMFGLMINIAKRIGITLDTGRWRGKGMDEALKLMLQHRCVEHGVGPKVGLSLFAQLAFIIMRDRGINAHLVIPHISELHRARKKIRKYRDYIFSDKIWKGKCEYLIVDDLDSCSLTFQNTFWRDKTYVSLGYPPEKGMFVIGD